MFGILRTVTASAFYSVKCILPSKLRQLPMLSLNEGVNVCVWHPPCKAALTHKPHAILTRLLPSIRTLAFSFMHSLYCKAAISNVKGKGYPYRFFTHFNILIFSVWQITICINFEHCCTFYLLLLKNFANLGRIIHYYLKKNLKSSFCLNYRETCESTGVIGRRGGVKLRNDFWDIQLMVFTSIPNSNFIGKKPFHLVKSRYRHS